jgi:aminoglycoside 6'-N-acetyltransferase I
LPIAGAVKPRVRSTNTVAAKGYAQMRVEPCCPGSLEDWVALRRALWPRLGEQEHRTEAAAMLAEADRACAFLARNGDEHAIGFAEATLRQDYVNGCVTSPVAFLEGIFVLPEWRRQGAARCLCAAVEAWAARLGCSEFASDADVDNHASQQMHRALGFAETERVVFYRKKLK